MLLMVLWRLCKTGRPQGDRRCDSQVLVLRVFISCEEKGAHFFILRGVHGNISECGCESSGNKELAGSWNSAMFDASGCMILFY